MKPIRIISLVCGIFLAAGVVHAASGDMTTLAVAAGWEQSLALRSDGTVWSWGSDTRRHYGLLGITNLYYSNFPVRIPSINQHRSRFGKRVDCMALKSDGTVWAWGDNTYGQLGNGNTGTNSCIPVKVTGISSAVAIASGWYHSLAVLSNGQVMAWGYNDDGQLGNGATRQQQCSCFSFRLDERCPSFRHVVQFGCADVCRFRLVFGKQGQRGIGQWGLRQSFYAGSNVELDQHREHRVRQLRSSFGFEIRRNCLVLGRQFIWGIGIGELRRNERPHKIPTLPMYKPSAQVTLVTRWPLLPMDNRLWSGEVSVLTAARHRFHFRPRLHLPRSFTVTFRVLD